MKPTVHDIAEEAGVSLATVDRVLNGRPGVRTGTREKVLRAMERLGYVRDVAAANLARKRVYAFEFLLPRNSNAFMQALRAELSAAQKRAAWERTELSLYDVPAFDGPALEGALLETLSRKPDGVAFVAVDSEHINEIVSRLKAEGISVVTLISDLADKDQGARDHYVGIDNVSAGRSAANLLGRFIGNLPARVGVLAGSLKVRDHRERLEGFLGVLGEAFPNLEVLPVLEGHDDDATVERLLQSKLEETPDIQGLYSLGAGNGGLISALSKSRNRPQFVIAHELDGTTVPALRAGVIDVVLAQDPGHEIRSAIRVLKAAADNVPIIRDQERIRIDIFLRDNLPEEDEGGADTEDVLASGTNSNA